MPPANAPDWAAISHAYVETDERVAEICARAGITAAQLKSRAAKESWRRKFPRPFITPRFAETVPGPAAPPPPPTPPPPDPPARSPRRAAKPTKPKPAKSKSAKPEPAADVPAPAPSTPRKKPAGSAAPLARRRLIARLVAAISLKLEQLERRMEQDLKAIEAGNAATATDHERETRAIGALIDNLGKITEIEADLADRNSGKAAAASDLGREADRFRRELAERLQRLAKPAAGTP